MDLAVYKDYCLIIGDNVDTLQKTGKVNRTWGYEVVWTSNDKYCGKILIFEKAGNTTALTIHKEKHKSWFVNAGKVKVSYIDTRTGERKESELQEGMTFEAGPVAPYQIQALHDETMLFEVSTPDHQNDNFLLSDDEKVEEEDQ